MLLGGDEPHMRLLLVEDDASFRAAVAESLEREGFEVDEAGTAREARHWLETDRFDVVVSDVGLPDDDGATLQDAFELQPDTPVVLVTAQDPERPLVRGLRQHACALLTKPVSLARLRETIARAIATT